MPSSSNFQTALEGVLVTQITAAATTATVKVKEINGVVPTWLTTAHRVTIIQKSRTVTKVEVVDVAAGTSQSGSTVTLGTMTRGLPLDGTGFTGTGTPQVFTSGARVIITWDAQAGRQTMFKDIDNTIVTGKKIFLGDSGNYITGTAAGDITLASNTTAAKTLAQLAAASGSDEKVKISATDTTQQYLDDALLVTSPITKTTNSGGANETLTIAIDTIPVTSGGTGVVSPTSGALLVGAGASAMTLIGPGTEGQVPLSNGTTIAMGEVPSRLIGSQLTTEAGDTIGNTATATNFATTKDIGANIAAAGDVFVIDAWGYMSTAASNTDLEILVLLDSTTILRTDTTTWPTSMTNRVWHLHGEFTVRVAGASGSIMPHGWFNTNLTGATNFNRNMKDSTSTTAPAAVSVDFTQALTVIVRVDWTTQDASNTITMQQLTVTRRS